MACKPNTECRHGANFVVIGNIACCRYDNHWPHQWWQSWYQDDFRFSVYRNNLSEGLSSSHQSYLKHRNIVYSSHAGLGTNCCVWIPVDYT